ncbi:MAG: CHAT domain-containing protein [Candidatus Aminicenantes bacterium]|nr:CHAT domain-containing protein [Candidatus Aminicenantes bacterium]
MNTKALEIAQILNHKIEAMKLFNNIGSYYTMKNNYAYALSNYFEALKIATEIQSKDKIRLYSINLANIYLKFGEFQKSSEYLSEALIAAREVKDDRKTAIVLNNLGNLYEKKADISKNKMDRSKALEKLSESLNLFQRERQKDMEIMVLNNMGHIYSDLKQYSEAMKYLKLGLDRAKNSSDQNSFGMILTNIGEIQLQLQDYIEAEKLYSQALGIGGKLESAVILRRAHFGFAKIYEEQKKYDLAIFHYQEAIKQIELVRSNIVLDVNQSGYLYSKLDVFEHLLNLYFTLYTQDPDKDYGAEMFLTAEKGKARSFLDNLEESKININEKLSDEYEKSELEITNRISTFLEQLSLSDNTPGSELERIEKELLQAEDDYAHLLNQMLLEKVNISKVVSPQPFNLNYLQDRFLTPDTVLIEYFLGEEKSFVFFVSKSIFEVFELPPHAKIKDSIKGYLKILTDPFQDDNISQKASRRLYLELFSPLDEIMPENVSNLIIIPDGILYYLPFETLLSSSQDKLTSENYLISRYSISYMPSSFSLLFLDNKKNTKSYPKELLAFGAPDYSIPSSSRLKNQQDPMGMLYEIYENQGYQFLPLPYSKKEIDKISDYFPIEKTDVYLRRDASEKTIKQLPLEDYRVLHFACHSFLDETFPMRSALVLSPDENFEEDGFLKVREIYNFNLNSELVVLSACSTGQGKMEGSDGVLGLPRIFFYAGAKSVVSTLWGINDESTVDFMNYFYQGLFEGKSKAQALQAAKIRMIKSKYSHPYYWGAFILNGDYRSTITSN